MILNLLFDWVNLSYMCTNYWENAAKCSTHDSHTHLYTYVHIYTQARSRSLSLSLSFSPHTHTDSGWFLSSRVSKAPCQQRRVLWTLHIPTWYVCTVYMVVVHVSLCTTWNGHISQITWFWCTYKVINRGCLHIRSSSVSVCKSMCCSINTLFSTCTVPGCCRGSLHTSQIGHFGY